MLTNFIFSVLAITGATLLWRKLLSDYEELDHAIRTKLPHLFSGSLTCGFCSTYWLTLIFVLVSDPLHDWLPLRITLPSVLVFVLQILVSWMAIAVTSVIIRFSYIALHDYIHYLEANTPEHHH